MIEAATIALLSSRPCPRKWYVAPAVVQTTWFDRVWRKRFARG